MERYQHANISQHLSNGNGWPTAVDVENAMKALCAAAPECAVTELDIQGASSSDYLKATNSCLNVKNCVGITSWGITDNTVSLSIFSPKTTQRRTLTTLPTVVARRQDSLALQQQRSAQACLHFYPERIVSDFTKTTFRPGWRNTESFCRSIFSSIRFRITVPDHK